MTITKLKETNGDQVRKLLEASSIATKYRYAIEQIVAGMGIELKRIN